MLNNSMLSRCVLIMNILVTLLFLIGCTEKRQPENILADYAELSPKTVFNQNSLLFLKNATKQVVYFDGMDSFPLINLDEKLEKPHTMVLVDSTLFVAGCNRIDAYSLEKNDSLIGTIFFSIQDSLISQILPIGDLLLVASQSGNQLYAIDIRSVSTFSEQKPYLYIEVAAPEAIACTDSVLYVASEGEDGNTQLSEIYPLNEPKVNSICSLKNNFKSMAVAIEDSKLFLFSESEMQLAILSITDLYHPEYITLSVPRDEYERNKYLLNNYRMSK